jgi:hypothetical protein
MHPDELEIWLAAWGLYYREEWPPVDPDERPRFSRSHPIAQALPFAPGTVAAAAQHLLGRDGRDRRRIMAKAVGLKHVHIVPMAYVDPVRCKEGAKGDGTHATRTVPPQVERIEREAKQLEELLLVRGLVFRAQYCVEGDTAGKALWVTSQWRKSKRDALVSINQFRNELAFARVWMQARLIGGLTAISVQA